MKRVNLVGVKNAKDLGGTMTKDGKVIKSKKLIKCGDLSGLTVEDRDLLMEKYKLKLVIDLRTKTERKMRPDPCFKGTVNMWNPIFMEELYESKIFKPVEKDELETNLKALFILKNGVDTFSAEAMEYIKELVTKNNFDPEAYMARMYQKFVNNQIIQKQIKQFFGLLTNNRKGAILYHCATGHDRSGLLTALLLYVLGVPKDKIISEYIGGEESSQGTIEYFLEAMFPSSVPGNKEYQDLARQLFGVKKCYVEEFFDAIEKDYVSIDNYLQKQIEIHVDNIVRLKTLYLDD